MKAVELAVVAACETKNFGGPHAFALAASSFVGGSSAN